MSFKKYLFGFLALVLGFGLFGFGAYNTYFFSADNTPWWVFACLFGGIIILLFVAFYALAETEPKS